MAGQHQQKRSLHIAHQYHDLLGELYDNDLDATVFVNHFGHIEYHNTAFSKIMMLDKHDKAFNNIFNMDQLPIKFEMNDQVLHITYPNGLTVYMTFLHQLVHFQKSTLLQLTYKNITPIYEAKKSLETYKSITMHYLSHLKTPMFLLNSDGLILGTPNGALKLFDKQCNQLTGESMFEVLPYDYANQVMDKIKHITLKINGHFMYQTEKDKIITVFDTTVDMIDENLYLCQLNDVSDLNTMSSTIEYLNSYDSLTGFYNTNYYENMISSLKDSSHLPMGVYTLRLHGLKQVNMRLGYHQCDNVIIEIALNMKALISQHEVPCRITGDTFVIFFPNCSKDTMNRFSQQMSNHIEDYKHKYKDYYLGYSEKSVLITDKATELSAILKGMIV